MPTDRVDFSYSWYNDGWCLRICGGQFHDIHLRAHNFSCGIKNSKRFIKQFPIFEIFRFFFTKSRIFINRLAFVYLTMIAENVRPRLFQLRKRFFFFVFFLLRLGMVFFLVTLFYEQTLKSLKTHIIWDVDDNQIFTCDNLAVLL